MVELEFQATMKWVKIIIQSVVHVWLKIRKGTHNFYGTKGICNSPKMYEDTASCGQSVYRLGCTEDGMVLKLNKKLLIMGAINVEIATAPPNCGELECCVE